MSSDTPVPVPRSGVPLGIEDPVEKARTELKAALAAIEHKVNLPRRVSKEVDDRVDAARRFAKRNPAAAAAAVVAGAALVGVVVWGCVRLYIR